MEFLDGGVCVYEVNIIIKNLIDQVDDQGWDIGILEEIVDFSCDPDVFIPTKEQAYTNVNRIQHLVITTKGWGAQVKFIDQSTDWVYLYIIKE